MAWDSTYRKLWSGHALAFSLNPIGEVNSMVKRVFALAFLCAGFLSSVTGFGSITNNDDRPASASQSVNPVIE